MRRRQPVVGVGLVAQGCDVRLLSIIRSAHTPPMRRVDPAFGRHARRRLDNVLTQNARRKLMPTFTQPALSILVDRLFAEADAAQNERWPAMRASDRGDYRRYYGLLKDQPLPVSRATGKLLYMLARSVRARTIIEFGTSFGISTLHLAAALRDNGGGRLIGSEFEPSNEDTAGARKPCGRRPV